MEGENGVRTTVRREYAAQPSVGRRDSGVARNSGENTFLTFFASVKGKLIDKQIHLIFKRKFA